MLPSWELMLRDLYTQMVTLSPSHQNSCGSDVDWLEPLPAPAELFLHGVPQDLCSVFYLELLLFSWLHCVLILSCQLIYRQHSPCRVCSLWGEETGIHQVLSVVLINALQLHISCGAQGRVPGTELPNPNFPVLSLRKSGCMQTAPCAWSLTPGSRAGMGLGSHKEAQVEKGRSCTKWHWGFGCSHLMEQLYLGHWVGRGNLKTCLGLLGMHMIKELRS